MMDLDSDLGSDSDSSSGSDSESKSSLDSTPEYETKHVHFKRSQSSWSRAKMDKDPMALVTKLQGLSAHEPSYLMLYAQLRKSFPKIAKNLPKPQIVSTASTTVAYQSNSAAIQPIQPTIQLSAPPPIPASIPTSTPVAGSSKSDFFHSAHAQGCAFCRHLGHCIHSCPAAEEYVDTGHVKTINCRLYLPTGQPIPNDGHG